MEQTSPSSACDTPPLLFQLSPAPALTSHCPTVPPTFTAQHLSKSSAPSTLIGACKAWAHALLAQAAPLLSRARLTFCRIGRPSALMPAVQVNHRVLAHCLQREL